MSRKLTITARDLAAMNRGERVKRKISPDGHTRLQVDKGKVSRARACGPLKTGHENHLSPPFSDYEFVSRKQNAGRVKTLKCTKHVHRAV